MDPLSSFSIKMNVTYTFYTKDGTVGTGSATGTATGVTSDTLKVINSLLGHVNEQIMHTDFYKQIQLDKIMINNFRNER